MTTDSTVPPIEVELSGSLDDGYDQPTVIDNILYAFPGHLDRLLPPLESIPEDYRLGWTGHNEWTRFVNAWFDIGWPTNVNVYERPDVDAEAAFRHLHTIMRSFEPKHEHKIAGVAWLMSRWFAAIRAKELS
jgi:hypothetical protein